MKSLDQSFIEQQSIPIEFAGTLRALGEYRGKQELFGHQTPQILETLKQIAIVQSTESSNRIEGVVVGEERLKILMEKKTAPRDRPEAEVVGYRDALAKIHNLFESYDISPETILKIHQDMFRLTELPAGSWKPRDNTVEERLPDGSWVTRFIPVPAKDTPYFVQGLCERFNQLRAERRVDQLLLIHAFVFDFLCIHPFLDGNGRVSRLLTVLLLHQAGYDVGRYISLEKLIEESKETYYEVLHRTSVGWHEGKHQLLPWWRYSLGILLVAYKQFEDRVGAVRTSRGAKTVWIHQAIENLPGEFSIGELSRACPGVSRPMIRVVLESLRNEGKLKSLGTGRGARWAKVKKDRG